ncbi:hypothetical protein [Krasilnikovia sp. M28-CT-15]|uniref:hypothetical protein n=1 Tax=Krasilnikovia sp. M28-CT-15 TaxID=3373540 RepID=UPI003877683D
MGERLTAIARRWQRWEQRTATRFAGWSVRRRWLVLVLLPTLLICGASIVGVPLALLTRATIAASRGAPSPDAAANIYLMALGYDNDAGLLPVLDDEPQDELLTQWRTYRDAMRGTDPPPAKLDFSSLTVGPIADGVAEVTVDVSAHWQGAGQSYRSQAYTWRFQTREDNGWQIVAVEAPAWCGGYVRADACSRR